MHRSWGLSSIHFNFLFSLEEKEGGKKGRLIQRRLSGWISRCLRTLRLPFLYLFISEKEKGGEAAAPRHPVLGPSLLHSGKGGGGGKKKKRKKECEMFNR